MKEHAPVILDVDLPDKGLQRGQVGTIVEVLGDGVYEVEFADLNGETYAMLSLRAEQLLLLHYNPVDEAS